MNGAERIAAERAAHAARGRTLEHDLGHEPGDLVDAAVSFACDQVGIEIQWEDGSETKVEKPPTIS